MKENKLPLPQTRDYDLYAVMNLIETIRGSVRIIDNHPDPGSLIDCWKSLDETVASMKADLETVYPLLFSDFDQKMEFNVRLIGKVVSRAKQIKKETTEQNGVKWMYMRDGQCLMIALQEVNPDAYKTVNQTEADCFYNDEKIDKFIEKVLAYDAQPIANETN